MVASNRYADPESVAPVSSLTAPIRILSPEIETELPKKSLTAGVGFTIVIGAPYVTANAGTCVTIPLENNVINERNTSNFDMLTMLFSLSLGESPI